MSGTLYIVATPIGHLEDITLRAIRILSDVHGIAAEDTRHTLKLLNRYEIRKPLISLHEHNESERISLLADKLANGEDWALVSDAGTPGLCDPGAQVVAALRANGFPCVPVPGPSALATAISVSGLDGSRFHFEGFLPSRGSQRIRRLHALAEMDNPVFLYEAPHRLTKTLRELLDTMGDRNITLFRELTKLHEEISDTTLKRALSEERESRGEFVLLIKPLDPVRTMVSDQTIVDHACELTANGMTCKQAALQTASDLGVRKNYVYNLLIDR